MDFGSALGRAVDIPEAKLRELPHFETSEAFSPVERLVLRYADLLTRTPADVPGELFDQLRSSFDERQLVALTAAIATENFLSRFNRGFDLQAQGYSEGGFCLLPDRPAPPEP